MPPEAATPVVAIVGRPNVGKSTLFNRYAGERRALVADRPGITRDRIAQAVEVGERRVLVVDTAGLLSEAEAGLPAAIQAQAWQAVREADAIVFVTDGKSGLLPDDETLARTLRRTAKPVLLAVNKVDTPAHEDRVAEFFRLGFERVRGISAEHGTGAWDALEELVTELPPSADAEPPPGLRVALVGRPNVGKSSLVNRLAGEERVVVSELPGTTRDAVDITLLRDGERYVLVDTAGMRRPGRRDRVAERASALVATRQLERCQVALVVCDAAEGFTDRDARIAGLARELGRPAALLANKWDRVREEGPDAAKRVRAGIERGLRFMADTPILPVSARTGAGVAKVFPVLARLARAGARRIRTADLNRWLEDTVRRHEPAMAQRGPRRRPLKFFYATQTGASPPTITLFCTDPAGVQPAYRRFLENRLRESFDLEGTPVRLRLRARREGARR